MKWSIRVCRRGRGEGTGLLPLSDLAVIARVIHGFRVLMYDDAKIAELATATLRAMFRIGGGRLPYGREYEL